MTRLALPTVALSLLLVGVLSGCVGSHAGEAGPVPLSTRSTPQSADVAACRIDSLQAPVPWEPVADAMPPGFEPAPYANDDVHRGRLAGMIVDVYACPRSRVADAPAGPVQEAMVKLRVDPPSRHRDDDLDAGSYWIAAFVLTDDDRRARALRGWGFQARVAPPRIDRTEVGTLRTARITGETGNFSLGVRTTMAAPDTLEIAGDVSRYFGLDRPLFSEGTPRVTSVVERATTPTVGMAGEGDLELGGSAVPERLRTRAGPAIGFAADGYGWSLTLLDRP